VVIILGKKMKKYYFWVRKRKGEVGAQVLGTWGGSGRVTNYVGKGGERLCGRGWGVNGEEV